MASKARTKAPVGGAKSKKAARLPSVLCSICEDAILDASAKYPGHDAIECEGLCKAWLHRGCAGLSKAAFQLASSSPKPFLCPTCRLVEHASELQTLKSTVNALCEELSALKDYLKGKESQTSPAPTNIAPEPVDDSAIAPAPVTRTDPEYTTERIKKLPHLSFIHDKKFNLVIFGVDECPEGTSRSERANSDLSQVSQILSSTDESFQSHSISDSFRLGKFSIDRRRPRPILVKLLRSSDVSSILSKRRSLTLPYSIKPDLSLEERKRESALLKERWSLIQSGIERKFIRIHNLSIFVNNKLHGRLDLSSNQFHCCSPLNTPLSPNSPLVTNSTSPNNVSSPTTSVITNSTASSIVSSPTTSVITNSTAPSIVNPPTTSNPVVPNLQSVPSIPDNVAMNSSLSACSSPSVPHVAISSPHSLSN